MQTSDPAPAPGGRGWRRGLPCVPAVLLSLWWSLPWWLPALSAATGASSAVPQVVSVAAGDFRRTQSAVALWRRRPGALLVLTVPQGSSQAMNQQLLQAAALTPSERARLRWIPTCGDSVTEMADLTGWVAGLPGDGTLTVVTSPAHLRRLQAIARVMAGGLGWRVEGVASLSSEHKPESAVRVLRDHLRAQLWRATGWTGRDSLVCPARAQGLL